MIFRMPRPLARGHRARVFAVLGLTLGTCHTTARRGAPTPDASRVVTGGMPIADTIRIDGSNGVMPLVAALADEYRITQPTSAISLGGGLGSKARLQALADRRIDIAVASHGLDEAALARDGMTAHRIALTPVVIGVHADVTVRGVSEAQACDLLTGRLTSWALLGGGNVAVRAYMRPESEVDTEVVRAGVSCLRQAGEEGAVTIVQATGDMVRALAEIPGAVGVTTATVVQQSGGKIRALALDGVAPTPANTESGRYRLTRASYLVSNVMPSPAVVRFLDFARSTAGHTVLAANGSIPVR